MLNFTAKHLLIYIQGMKLQRVHQGGQKQRNRFLRLLKMDRIVW